MKKTRILLIIGSTLILSSCKKVLDMVKPEPPKEEKCDCTVDHYIREFSEDEGYLKPIDTVWYQYDVAGRATEISSKTPGFHHPWFKGEYDAQGRILQHRVGYLPDNGFSEGWLLFKFIDATTAKVLGYTYSQPKLVNGQTYPQNYEPTHWDAPAPNAEYASAIYYFDSNKRVIKIAGDYGNRVFNYAHDDSGHQPSPGYSNVKRPGTYLENLSDLNFDKYYKLGEQPAAQFVNDCGYPTVGLGQLFYICK